MRATRPAVDVFTAHAHFALYEHGCAARAARLLAEAAEALELSGSVAQLAAAPSPWQRLGGGGAGGPASGGAPSFVCLVHLTNLMLQH